MKARVKATGEIVEVVPYNGFDDYDYYQPKEKMPWLKEQLVFDVTDKDDIYNKGWADGWDEAIKSEIPKIHPRLKGSDPDYWTRLEHQAAIAAMQGICANHSWDKCTWDKCTWDIIVDDAYEVAHTLIQKLKEKEER